MSKVRFKLKNIPLSEFSLDYIGEYLQNLGIQKIESFLGKPPVEDEESWENLDNIREACEILHEAFLTNKKVFLQVDSDVDGYTSSAIFYRFFKEYFPNADIEYRLHDGKEHGVILNTVPLGTDVVVLPDSGSMQFDEQEELSQRGIKVVILDHHNVEDAPNFPGVIIVNNQSSERFANKALSGAGIVYKTIQAYENIYGEQPIHKFRKYTDLAAIGIISDMMDTKTLDNNFIIFRGLGNIQNEMIRALLEKQQFSVEKSGASIEAPTKITIAFYVAPLINAVIRFGTDTEKDELFRGFIGETFTQVVETEYRGVSRRENFYDYVARIATNVRSRQNREKEKSMEFLSKRIEANQLDRHQLLIVKVSKDDEVPLPQTITGLVAMELLKKYKKPTLVLRPKSDGDGGTVFAGSGRGKINGEFTSLFKMLRESGLCEYVEGHDMAHGVAIKDQNVPKVIEYANEVLKDIEFDVEDVEVDFAFSNSNMNVTMLKDFGGVVHLYGNGIPQPKFGFQLKVADSSIRIIGKKENTLAFTVGGVDFIKFGADKIIQKMKESPSTLFNFTAVGRAQINEWGGKKTPQIMIDEIDVESIGLVDLF